MFAFLSAIPYWLLPLFVIGMPYCQARRSQLPRSTIGRNGSQLWTSTKLAPRWSSNGGMIRRWLPGSRENTVHPGRLIQNRIWDWESQIAIYFGVPETLKSFVEFLFLHLLMFLHAPPAPSLMCLVQRCAELSMCFCRCLWRQTRWVFAGASGANLHA